MFALILALPLLLVLVLFAVSNADPVSLHLWPFDLVWVVPLAGAVLGAALLAFLLGAVLAWGAGLRFRAQARQLRRANERLEAELTELRAQKAVPVANAPAGTSLAPLRQSA